MDLLTYLRAQWDRVAGLGCIAAGAVLMVSGAIQMSRSRTILSQLSYLGSGALIGLFLLIVGIGFLVTAGLRDEWRKLDDIQAAIEAAVPADPADAADAVPGRAAAEQAPITDLRESRPQPGRPAPMSARR